MLETVVNLCVLVYGGRYGAYTTVRAAAATALGAGTLGAGSAGSAAHSWLRSAVNVCCLRILQSIGFAGIVFCWLEVKLKHYIFNS